MPYKFNDTDDVERVAQSSEQNNFDYIYNIFYTNLMTQMMFREWQSTLMTIILV